MAELKMLAIDLGASSGRGIVGSFDGEKLTLRENHRFTNDPVFVNGRFTWDILRIFHEIKRSITKTVIDGDNILIDFKHTAFDATDADTSNVVIVVDGGDQHL